MTQSAFESAAAVALDTHYSVFGVAAVYSPAGGDPVDVTVIVEDRSLDTQDGRSVRHRVSVLSARVRKAEVAALNRGDSISIEDETTTYTIVPSAAVSDGLEWTFEARSDAPVRYGDNEMFPNTGR